MDIGKINVLVTAGKTVPTQVAEGDDHHGQMCSTVCALVDGRKPPPVHGAEGQDQHDTGCCISLQLAPVAFPVIK